LLERERSGEGQWVQTSLLSTGINLMDFLAARYLVDGTVAGRVGNDHPTSMPTSAYRTSDGYLNIGAGNEVMWLRLCSALGDDALATRPQFRLNEDRIANRALLNTVLGAHFEQRTTAEWVEVLLLADVPCGPVYTMDQVFDDPQVKHCGIGQTVQHPRRGPLRLVSQAIELSRTPPRIVAPLEDRGASTETLLEELGYDHAAVQELRAQRVV
jgi:crotonobetainyl-CoA:carnitine CoA-transferase CaiB-like acyl-CoA transferase